MNDRRDDIKYLQTILNLDQKIEIDDENFFSEKLKLKKILKEKFYHNLPMSNINAFFDFSNDNCKYSFEYQRYDSKLEFESFFENFYDLYNIKGKTIFTSSGMATIFSLLYTLSKNCNLKITYEPDIYYETQKIIKSLDKFKIKKLKKILYLDTISKNFSFNYRFDNYDLIIIDTTCYHGHYFKKGVTNIINLGVPCILVRSHIKLDMLGLEYSNLGSVTFLIPEKVKVFKLKEIMAIINYQIDFIGNSGLNVTEQNVFPLLNDKKIINLNRDRIKRINYNNGLLFSILKKQIEYLNKPNHCLFLLITFKKEYSIAELKRKILDFCVESKLCNFSPTFALDYISLDTYYDFAFQKYIIRVSIGDVSEDLIKKFAKKFGVFYENL